MEKERAQVTAPVLPKPDFSEGGDTPEYVRKIEPSVSSTSVEDFPSEQESVDQLSGLMSEGAEVSEEIGDNRWVDALGGETPETPATEEPVTIKQPEPPEPAEAFEVDEIIEGQATSLQRQWQELEQQSNSINWQQLHSQDPQRAERAWLGVVAKADGIKAAYANTLQRHQAKGAEHLEKVFSGPQWRDAPAWGEGEAARLTQFLMELGATPQQIAMETNPAVFVESRRAMCARDGVTVGKARSTSQKVKVKKKTTTTQAKPRKKRNTNPRNFYDGVDRIADILAGR